jgi:hypothetical protein
MRTLADPHPLAPQEITYKRAQGTSTAPTPTHFSLTPRASPGGTSATPVPSTLPPRAQKPAVTPTDMSTTSEVESTTSEDESMTSEDESMTSEDESTASENESTTSENKSTTSEDESTILQDEHTTSQDVVPPPIAKPLFTSQPSSSVPPPKPIGAMPGHPTSPSLSLASRHDSPPSQRPGIVEWSPQYKPTWKLGPGHPAYVHSAVPYLIGVPGGPEWEKLLEHWVVFESLSFSKPVSALNI